MEKPRWRMFMTRPHARTLIDIVQGKSGRATWLFRNSQESVACDIFVTRVIGWNLKEALTGALRPKCDNREQTFGSGQQTAATFACGAMLRCAYGDNQR